MAWATKMEVDGKFSCDISCWNIVTISWVLVQSAQFFEAFTWIL